VHGKVPITRNEIVVKGGIRHDSIAHKDSRTSKCWSKWPDNNDPSGGSCRDYKKCCLPNDEAKQRADPEDDEMGDSPTSWLSSFIPASSTISGFSILAAVQPLRSQPSVSARYSRSRAATSRRT
jgi:hypothetical protein